MTFSLNSDGRRTPMSPEVLLTLEPPAPAHRGTDVGQEHSGGPEGHGGHGRYVHAATGLLLGREAIGVVDDPSEGLP